MGDERIKLSAFIKILEINDTNTPLTDTFDRTHPQKSPRWWINMVGNSCYKHHVCGHFLCKYYNRSPYEERCKNKSCEDCYSKGEYVIAPPYSDINGRTAYDIYRDMKRPEMYLWFVEAFGLLDDDTMQDCFKSVENKYTEYESSEIDYRKCMNDIKDILQKNYGITWEKVEAKVSEYGIENQIKKSGKVKI